MPCSKESAKSSCYLARISHKTVTFVAPLGQNLRHAFWEDVHKALQPRLLDDRIGLPNTRISNVEHGILRFRLTSNVDARGI